MKTRQTYYLFYVSVILVVFGVVPSDAFVGGAFSRISNDFRALTRRVTAHHILVSNEELALALKRKIRDESIERNEYVVTVFETAAKKYSQDDSTVARGGLLGKLVPQGFCQSPELDRACFEVALGVLEGPLKTHLGYHLLLVTERTNCPKLDGGMSQLIQSSDNDIFGTKVAGTQVGQVTAGFVLLQVFYWCLIFLAGGIVAELAAQVASPTP